MKRPTLTVAMGNYNHGRFLPESLSAIVEQSYQPVEFIIIDDASTDNSIEILEDFARRYPVIRLFRNERNRGMMDNTNRLLHMASGDYFLLTAADDLVFPGFFEKTMDLVSRYPEAGLSTTLWTLMDENGVDHGVVPSAVVASEPAYLPPERIRKLLVWIGNWMQGNTTIYRRQALLDIGGFPPELGSASDNFTSHVLALKHGACFIPEPLSAYRKMASGWAARSRANAELELAMLAAARELMQTRFRDLFPPRYVQLWQDQMFFDRARIIYDRVRAEQEVFVSQLGLLEPKPGPWSRFLGRLIRLSFQAQWVVTLGCVAMGHFPWQLVRRRVHTLLHPIPANIRTGRRPGAGAPDGHQAIGKSGSPQT